MMNFMGVNLTQSRSGGIRNNNNCTGWVAKYCFLVKAVTPKCLGSPTEDYDRLNAYSDVNCGAPSCNANPVKRFPLTTFGENRGICNDAGLSIGCLWRVPRGPDRLTLLDFHVINFDPPTPMKPVVLHSGPK
ncbi:hypothetical protein TNCV_4751351 [Trichonephila clavipes]|nr:hypothetical protein TNCV_4751351 [Trichonephila clavipes]